MDLSFVNKATGEQVTGELVIESSTAHQVAVDGKVRLLMKGEWKPLDGFDALLGDGIFENPTFGDLFRK